MFKNLSNQGKVRLITFGSALVLVLAIYSIAATVKLSYYTREVNTTKTVALGSLADYVADMEENLCKCAYSNTPTVLGTTTANLWRDSYEARSLLEELPFDSEDMEATNAFLAKVAEYAKAIGTRVSTGGTLTDEEYKTLRKLESYVSQLKDNVYSLQAVWAQGDALGDKQGTFENPERLSKTALKVLCDTTTKQSLSNVPQLIYDGPYSDGVAGSKAPKALVGEKVVSEKVARKRAAKLLNCAVAKVRRGKDEKGAIPAYTYSHGTKSLAISKQGGKLVYSTDSAVPKRRAVSVKQCVQNAGQYLKSIGLRNMVSNYYQREGNTVTVNFHYQKAGVKCYTDLVKVNVRCDNGTVAEVDCRTYLTNHDKLRKFSRPEVNLTEAKGSVSPHLVIRNSAMAVIPTESGKEKYTYEFLCRADSGQEVLVYIDTATGNEADMLILKTNKNGTLAY